MIAEIYQRDLDVFGMPAEWDLSIVVPDFKGKVISGTVAAIEL